MKGWLALIVAVALAGCANESPLPNGKRVTGQDLEELISGATIYGISYERKPGFVERYHPNGHYDVAFATTASSDEYGSKHRGTWRIDNSQVCYRVESLNSDSCVIIYRQYTQIEYVLPETGKAAYFSFEIEYGGKSTPPRESATPIQPAYPPLAAAPPPPAPPKAPKPTRKLKPVASGSGFIVSSQTYVLTNEHVIEKCAEVTVRIDGLDIPATVTARDRRNDLALLRLPAGKYPVVFFRGNDGLYPGDSVVAIGYPLSDLLASEGNVSIGIVSALAGIGNDASLLQVSTPVQPGNSGGPLFDMSENVVGVIVAGLGKKFFETDGTLPQNVNFAIKSAVAKAFMQASGVEYQSRKSTKELRPADVARKGRPATVYIKCWG